MSTNDHAQENTLENDHQPLLIGFRGIRGLTARGPNAALSCFIREGLYEPANAMAYVMSERLHELFPDKALAAGRDYHFDLVQYARDGHCRLDPKPGPFLHWETTWKEDDELGVISLEAAQAWFLVEWQGKTLEALIIHRRSEWCDRRHFFVLAESLDEAHAFVRAVCSWNAKLRDEVLVYNGAYWDKDEDLFRSIKEASFDKLVLPPGLKEALRRDTRTFFAGAEVYARYSIPWKRGLLFLGPPGNGKTQVIKALAGELKRPILYVKSFHRRGAPDEESIAEVFEQARRSAPCVLIFEDLDALIGDSNRSFFLNELDGFARNAGILTLATTNHPERLDPAIINRPSRFDRKYHFRLPNREERATYISHWNRSFEPALRIGDRAVGELAARTKGFSYAYLKELFVSALTRWVDSRQPGGLEPLLREELSGLRRQIATSANQGDGGRQRKGGRRVARAGSGRR